MAIQKIILDDKTEIEFGFVIPKGFEDWEESRKAWFTYRHKQNWEQQVIFPELETDLEKYAKDEYNLIDEYDKVDISDFDDDDLLKEAEKRGIHINNTSIQNENIINQNFLSRFAQIINRGNDIEIEKILDELEKKYHIA